MRSLAILCTPFLLAALPRQGAAGADSEAFPATVAAGWTTLFDGESLEGWTTVGGRYDGHALWWVEDGVIHGKEGPGGAGGLLYTERDFTAFELEFETNVDWPFDSGLFVRMAPQGKGAQVTIDHRPGGEIGAIYSDGFLAHNPDGAKRYRRGEWNRFRVRVTGFDLHIEAWLNGEPLVDYRLPPDTPGYAPTGKIGIQVHGGGEPDRQVRFRNLRLRELPVFGEGLFERDEHGLPRASEAASAAGWEPLFDGRSLAGWRPAGETECYRIEDGVLEFLKRGAGGNLYTADTFRDFRLRLDFRLAKMANSGVYLRSVLDGTNPSFNGAEVQILDDFHWEQVTGTKLKPWQFTGSLYGAVPPGDRGALRPVGEWNTFEILYRGPRLAVALNGRTLYDVDTHALAAEPPFAERSPEGVLGLQRYSAEHVEGDVVLSFRDLFVQRL